MSVSAEQPDSTDRRPDALDRIPADSREPYTDAEWRRLNEALFDHDAALGPVHMRWIAADALMALSILAEHPEASERLRMLAARTLRRARDRVNAAIAREAAV